MGFIVIIVFVAAVLMIPVTVTFLELIAQVGRFFRNIKIGYDEATREDLRGRGCCEKCGYSLRGTPYRCPECGALAPVKT